MNQYSNTLRGLSIAVIVLSIFMFRGARSAFVYSVHSHEVIVKTAWGAATLFVDGVSADELQASNIRVATVRAVVDGEEFRAAVHFRAFRVEVQATHGGREVSPVRAGK